MKTFPSTSQHKVQLQRDKLQKTLKLQWKLLLLPFLQHLLFFWVYHSVCSLYVINRKFQPLMLIWLQHTLWVGSRSGWSSDDSSSNCQSGVCFYGWKGQRLTLQVRIGTVLNMSVSSLSSSMPPCGQTDNLQLCKWFLLFLPLTGIKISVISKCHGYKALHYNFNLGRRYNFHNFWLVSANEFPLNEWKTGSLTVTVEFNSNPTLQ